MAYVVKYKVRGFGDGEGPESDQQAGPYDTWELAEEHRADIHGFEGVFDCRIQEVSDGDGG
jgi:hypothetical protein